MNLNDAQKFSEDEKKEFLRQMKIQNQYRSDSQQILPQFQFAEEFDLLKARLINTDQARQDDRKNFKDFPVDTDYKKGFLLFQQQCGSCHALTNYDDKILQGPFLGNVYGRIAGKMMNKKYPISFTTLTFRWNKKTLNEYLKQENIIENQQVKKDKCKINNKFQNLQNRADLIQFLKKNTVEFNRTNQNYSQSN